MILWIEVNYKEFIFILYTPEFLKYIQTEDILLLTMVVWADLIGFVL